MVWMVMAIMECNHELYEVMIDDHGVYEFVDFFFCKKCRRMFKKTLNEVTW